jgi:hypothetical protein
MFLLIFTIHAGKQLGIVHVLVITDLLLLKLMFFLFLEESMLLSKKSFTKLSLTGLAYIWSLT